MQSELIQRLTDGEFLVFGHRGASGYVPENTLQAFELAYQQGASGIELDVVLSAERQPMVIHNFSLDHTTDGTGQVSEYSVERLKQFDAGSWKDEQFKGLQIPTLTEVFAAFGTKLYINVEIKAATNSRLNDGVEEVVAETIRHFNLASRVIVSSFDMKSLEKFGAIAPEIPTGYLFEQAQATFAFSHLNETQALHPYHGMIDSDFMRLAKKQGKIVNAWTVNDPERGRVLRSLGVGIIITDLPDVMSNAIQI